MIIHVYMAADMMIIWLQNHNKNFTVELKMELAVIDIYKNNNLLSCFME